MSYFRPAIDATPGYMPGEQPPPGAPVLKLNTNENPYPPSPQAIAVLQTLDGEWLRRYPDPYGRDFCQAVSQALGVPETWLLLGNGSDELLTLLMRACVEGRDRPIAYPTPTYVLYPTLASFQPAHTIEIPYGPDFHLPIEELVATQAALTLIATPNSPTGHAVPLADLRHLAKRTAGIVVIDEAYVDFAETTALPLVQEFANVIVLRTLSKGYSLAGLRLGFAIAQPGLINPLFKVKDSYNMDAIALRVGAAAMADQAYKNACAERVKRSRDLLTTALTQLNFAVLPSQGNFVLATPPARNAEALYLALKAQGILVRYFKQPGLDDKLRITVGTDAQIEQLIAALSPML
ncbi:MAG: histidinol-phosphate transaminase [Cyanobacteria bacterium J06639_16]